MRNTVVPPVLMQLYDPDRAYAALQGERQGTALGGTVLLVLLISVLPFLLQGTGLTFDYRIPLLIVVERAVIAGAAGLSAFALSYAMNDRKALWPGMTSCFMAMGGFMIAVALLTLVSYLFSLPVDFSWSPAEFVSWQPDSKPAVFLYLFLSYCDLASLYTVYLWGRGLDAVWHLTQKRGQRIAWTVYLFGILLISMPVFLSAP